MLVLATICLVGCGGSRSKSSAYRSAGSDDAARAHRSYTSLPHYLNDGDNDPYNDNDTDDQYRNTTDEDNDGPEDRTDPENNLYHDKDDYSSLSGGTVMFAHAASADETRVIAAVVKRYYAAAVADDGSKACSMILSGIAKSIPEDYGHSRSASYLRSANTCAALMTLLFRHSRAQLNGPIAVTGVRSDGNSAIALLGSTKMPASSILLTRENGKWKILSLLEDPLS